MAKLLAVALFLAVAHASEPDLDARLEAALHTEMVGGDLKGAVDQYNAIVARANENRPVAARALWQAAQCQERLGQRAAARASYQRLVKDFSDQSEFVTRARSRLAAWSFDPAGPRNLDFEHGEAGRTPSGWTGSPVELRRQGCRSNLGCAVVLGTGKLTQSLSAVPYRGKTVRLRASLRVEASATGDHAQLLVADDRGNVQQANVDSARWTPCELATEIDGAAQSIQLAVMASGRGRVWVDEVAFQVVPEKEINAVRATLQKLYFSLDPAYLQPDFDELANAAVPDAQYRDADLKEPFRKAIERWKGASQNELARHTAVTAIKLAGSGAIATARAEYVRSEANRTRSVSYVDTRLDTWARNGSTWKLKEYRVLATRQVDSTTDAQTAKRAAADLKQTAPPLATIEFGHTFYDLVPFGAAVGDARIVALGEATFGTHEFFEIKHRLLEYLVKEKGFTIFAINANFLEATTLDLYIKSGEGDPKALLKGMLWPWNTEEALAVVEWMREFNKAPGPHATLRFASFGIPPASVVIPRVLEYLKQCSPLDAFTADSNYAPLLEMESKLGEVYDDAASRAADKAEAVVRLLDAKRDLLIQSSSLTAWRDARQAAENARQNAATRIAGKGSAYNNEMMARNVKFLAKDAYPGEKIVVWGHNALVGFALADAERSMGTWLREEFGDQLYVTGFAFHRGELLAPAFQNGKYEPVARQVIPESTEGNGDSVFSAAGMPVFFLDLRTVPTTTALGRWLAESHSFLEVGALWNRDDPQSNSRVKTLTKSYDGLIFLEEGHAAAPL